MANSLLTYGNKKSNSSTALLSKYAPIATQYQPATATKESDEEKNKGGFFGGLGYTLGKLGTGVFSILEGAWDFTAGGIADLLGADEWAEEQFANNIAGGWSQSLDEWYNPSKGMQVVGDVASGIGNSLVGIGVAAGASLISGGALAPAALSWLAAGTMGLGAAGGATSEAYAKTGKLGGKEYLYGALSGGTEMVLEKVSGGIESTLAKSFAKDTAKTLTKKSVVSGIVKNFASEAFEEGVSEIITPYYQRFTGVDPDAKNATAKQVGYAALVGGLSGALMGGVGDGIGAIRATSRGNTISQNPEQVDAILGMAREFAEYEAEHGTGNENYQYVAQLISEYEAKDNGTGTLTVAQKRALGHLERAVVKCAYQPMVESSKQQIIANADAFVEAINARNYPDGKGGVLHFNSGADFVANEAMLTSFAVQDALGKLLLSADSVYDLAMNKRGEGMLQADFRNFQKNATPESKAGINEAFGVDIDSIAYEDFMEKLSTTNRSVLEERKAGMYARATSKKLITNALRAGTEINAFDKKADMPEGTNLYKAKDGKLFTVTKTADGYYLYLDGKITVKLDKKQLLQAINELNGVKPRAKKKATTTQTAAPTPVIPTETRVERQEENAEPVAAAQTEENAPVAEEVAAADNTPAETTTQTEERAEAPVEQEQAADNTETVAETPVETPQTSETATDNESGRAEPQTRKKTAKKKPATVSNTESVAKTKAPTKATARRKLVRISMSEAVRDSLKGTGVKDGKQYVSDGFFAVRYSDILEQTVEANDFPFEAMDRAISAYATENTSDRITVDANALRSLAPNKKEKGTATTSRLGDDSYYQVRYLSAIVDSLENPIVYIKRGQGAYSTLYIKADNGEAILLPYRKGEESNVVYEADYDNAGEEQRKKTQERAAAREKTKKENLERWRKGAEDSNQFYEKIVTTAAQSLLDGVRFAVAENETAVPAGNKSQNLPPLQMKRAESYARQKVKGYDDLSAAQKLEVEWTIASGWRNGVEESQILTLARLSAQAKIGIGFADLTATDKNGNSVSIDAACYSRGGHLTVYLNPKSKRTIEVATLHELTHAMEGMEGYAELQAMAEEYYKAHPDEKAKIDNAYRNLYKNEQAKYTEEILPAELTAHYVETMLEKRNILAEMTTEKPPFMKQCINWLKKRVSALKGVDNAAAQEVERLAKKWESTFNLNKGKMASNAVNKFGVSKNKKSAVDAAGHILSGEQQEYFSESKVRDSRAGLFPYITAPL